MGDKVVEILKSHLVRLATAQFMSWLVSQMAWTAWGPITVFIQFFVRKVVVIVLEKTELGARLIAIHADAYVDSSKVQKIVGEINEKQKETASDEELRELDEKLAKAGRELIRYGSI